MSNKPESIFITEETASRFDLAINSKELKPTEYIRIDLLKSPDFLQKHGLVMMPAHMFSTCGVASCGHNETGTCELNKTRTCVPFKKPSSGVTNKNKGDQDG